MRSHALLSEPAKSTILDAEFHLHPQYREHTPSELLLSKRQAANDDFPNEKAHDRIALLLAEWSESLLRSLGNTQAFETRWSADFRGCSLHELASQTAHTDSSLEVRRISFRGDASLDSAAFASELQHYLSAFAKLTTAEFQVTTIGRSSGGQLLTEVRYELVGGGTGFYREQRVGTLSLEWDENSVGGFLLRRWLQSSEVRSRSASPVYIDVTRRAFGSNPSYAAQFMHGVDYWRTVLDGACGIDIYGHNGVSVGDIDGDGWDDVYVCQPAGLPNRLYRNRGDGTFEDVTEGSGVALLENTACAIFADFNNDGRQDLIVVRANGPTFFLNDGKGKFRQKPDAFQFANAPQGTFTGAAAADYDRDGWLDIYFCLYVYYQGTDQYKYPTPYYDANNGPPNFLLKNNRDGTFRDVTAETGLNQNNTRYSFCCGWTDSNGDGWPDLYVANDFGRKNLYRNNANGTFTDVATELGVADVGAGMSVCSFDYDNDGTQDLYVANMWTAAGERITAQETFRQKSPPRVRALFRKHAMGNSLFRNRPLGHFEDATAVAGVGVGRWAWSSDAWDFNHDGLEDVYIANGMVSGPLREDMNSFFWRQVVANSPDEARHSERYEQGWNAINELIRADYSWSGFERNIFYLNHRNSTFSDVSGAIGLDFLEDGRAFALADFNHDGRLEMLLKNRNAPQLRLMQNVVTDLPPSLSFRLRGTKSNRDAIGASITIETSSGHQTRMLQAGSGFLSQHSKEVFFGLGQARDRINASIRWPSGLTQTINGLPINHRIWVEEGNDHYRVEPFGTFSGDPTVQAPQQFETMPETVETWLLAPVSAPDFSLPASDGTTRTLSALHGRLVLLHFSTSQWPGWADQIGQLNHVSRSLEVLVFNFDASSSAHKHKSSFPVLNASDDMAAIYNILYRSLFDRHRDLSLPTSLLINQMGEIVKIYQGRLNVDQVREDAGQIPNSFKERMSKALPFSGDAGIFSIGRNFLSLGSTYFQKGYVDAAEAAFRRALEDDETSAEGHYGLGSCFLKQGKTAEARESFNQTVKLNSAYPETKPNAWNNLGLLETRAGHDDQAIFYFHKALQLNPDHLISLENLGNAYRQEKRWREAQDTLERALSLAPDDPEVNYSLAMVFAQTDQPDRAYQLLQKALQLRPAYPEAMTNLGVLYLRTHRRDDAVAEFEASIRLAPSFEGAYLNLARVYLIEENREKARTILLALLKQNPSQAQALALLKDLN